MTNAEISEVFSLLSKLTDLHGGDSFKAKSYSIAAYNIDQIAAPLSGMPTEAIAQLKGIGQSTAIKIQEIIQTGKLQQLEDIIHDTPSGVLEMMQIKGLGPKKLRVIWKEMGIESIGELEYACHENRLANFKGFGEKTQTAIIQNIAFIRSAQGFQLWATIEPVVNAWLQKLRQSFPNCEFLPTGAFYRQLPVIAQIDIVSDLPSDTLQKLWAAAPGIIIQQDGNLCTLKMPNQLPIVFHFVSKDFLYTEQFKHAGSEAFIESYIAHYGALQKGNSEQDFFEKHKIQYIPPAYRETEDSIIKAQESRIPASIQVKDIKGIIHAHSTWSDGQATLKDMAEHARANAFEYLLITDHSQSAFYANGLKSERVIAQHAEIEQLNTQWNDFKIFKGIESDILNDGQLDYGEEILKEFDLIIASIHSNLNMSKEKAMQRLLNAIQNPYTSILGHATGRLLLSREGYPIDHKLIIDACAQYNVAIEINAHPKRLDIDWQWIDYALSQNVLLSINPDAHVLSGYEDIRYGCLVAQKGGLTAQHNLSSFSREALESFIESQKRKRNLHTL